MSSGCKELDISEPNFYPIYAMYFGSSPTKINIIQIDGGL